MSEVLLSSSCAVTRPARSLASTLSVGCKGGRPVGVRGRGLTTFLAPRRDEDARTESGTRRTDGIPARRLLPEVRTVVQGGVLDNFLKNFALEPFRDRKRGVA